MKEKVYWVYMILCNNDTFYTGFTVDLNRRYELHKKGLASKYTRSFKPIRIVQNWKINCDRSVVLKIERKIKKLSRSEKEKLIQEPGLLNKEIKIRLINN